MSINSSSINSNSINGITDDYRDWILVEIFEVPYASGGVARFSTSYEKVEQEDNTLRIYDPSTIGFKLTFDGQEYNIAVPVEPSTSPFVLVKNLSVKKLTDSIEIEIKNEI